MAFKLFKSSFNEWQLPDHEFFEKLRKEEFARLDLNGHTYLDYTGGNLYPVSIVRKHAELLETGVFGNPHSTNPTSARSTALVEGARQQILHFFKASDYYCIFTANASASLKIIGECFPFEAGSQFVILADNHNSVNGIREFCQSKGGSARYVKIDEKELTIDAEDLHQSFAQATPNKRHLFAFPAQSNVSGMKHDLFWVEKAQQAGFDVLLDAAAFVPSSVLDLSLVKPQYVSVSFYKMFGYPTGIGCLLIRKDAFNGLQKPWFAGGTVSYVSVGNPVHMLIQNHERFEDGTLNYLGIPAISYGIDFLNRLGMPVISRRIKAMGEALYKHLSELKHSNGQPMLRIFGSENMSQRSGNLVMDFLDTEGKSIPIWEIESKANEKLISIRTGCFCNPGIDEVNHCVSASESISYLDLKADETHDYYRMLTFLDKLRGSVRVSVGIATSQKDLNTFMNFVSTYKDHSTPNDWKPSLELYKNARGYGEKLH